MRGSLDSPFVSITGQDGSLSAGNTTEAMHRRIRVGSFYRTKGKMQVQMLRTVLAQCFIYKELSHT